MRPLPPAASALVAAGALVVASGCGGGGGEGGGVDNTRDLEPAEILRMSADALAEAGPYRLALEGQVEAGDLAPTSLLRGTLDVEGAGSVVPGTGTTLDVEVDAGLPVEAGIVLLDDDLYVDVLGRRIVVSVPPERARALDPGRVVQALPALVDAPTAGGGDEVDGVAVTLVEGTLDSAALEEALAALGVDPAPGQVESGSVGVLVGREDLLPRRVRVDVGEPGDGDGAAVDLSIELTDFGSDLRIGAPQGARRVSPDTLAGVLGG